ncbi:MAG: trypsin-like peptidase domain-containing protein, partial [Polyangiaceae bacterium]|nr:trypsin-like peptidase domain-containing protein [Polyangiaceae bacterium]
VSFGATSGARAEVRQCARIVGATLTDDPETLTADYAIFALDRRVERLPLALDPEPLAPGDVVTVISSSPDRSGGSVHSVRARRCVVDGAEAAARELGPRAHSVSWLGLCPIRPGNSGAPVLDALGKLRGLVHGGSAPFFAHAVMTPAARISSRTGRATPALP